MDKEVVLFGAAEDVTLGPIYVEFPGRNITMAKDKPEPDHTDPKQVEKDLNSDKVSPPRTGEHKSK